MGQSRRSGWRTRASGRSAHDDAEPGSSTSASDAPSEPANAVISRRGAALLFVPVVIAVVAASIGDALTTTWAESNPVPLMLLNSRNRILVLTSNQVDAVTFYAVGTFRLMLTDPLYFLIGMRWGPRAIEWVSEKTGGHRGPLARVLAWGERHFDRAAIPFILIAPNPFISIMAGASRMRLTSFFALNFIGTVGRLFLLRRLGEAFEEQIESVLDFFADFRLPLLFLSISLVAYGVFKGRSDGDDELGGILSLEHELSPGMAVRRQASDPMSNELSNGRRRTARLFVNWLDGPSRELPAQGD